MLTILLAEAAAARIGSRLAAIGEDVAVERVQPDGTLASGRDPADAGIEIAWIDFDLLRPAAYETLRIASAGPAMRWIQASSAGVEHPFYADATRRGIRLSNSDAMAPAVADHVLASVLDHFRNGPQLRDAQAARRWHPALFREMDGTRWLIIGFGAIGKAVARRARGFGCHITAAMRRPAPHELLDAASGFGALQGVLRRSDVVVLAVPSAPETRGMADAAFLAAMAPGSVLVNIARGEIVDEAALLAALANGRPAHAILDVFAVEPLPPSSPWWDHPHVRVTPHTAFFGSGVERRNDDLFIANVVRYRANEPLLNALGAPDAGIEEALDDHPA